MPSLSTLIRQTYRMAHPRERRVVLDNVAALSILQAVTFFLPLLIIPYLFRVLGPDKFGLIAFAQAFVQYFVILTNYGFNISATREISICRHDLAKVSRAFSSIMAIKILLTLLSVLILSGIVFGVARFRSDAGVYVLSFGAVVGSTLFPVWFFQGIERMKYITRLNIVVGIISALLILVLVHGPKDYLLVPLINSAALIAIGLWGQVIVFRNFDVTLKLPERDHLGEELKAGWDVFLSVAAINAYTTTRVFLLGLLTNNSITGFYSIAERIALAFQTFPLDSFSQALFPRLSKIFHKSKPKALKLMRQIQRITTILALLTLPFVIIFADPLVTLVCGGDYLETVISLKLLLVAVFFVSANAFRVQFLLVSGKTRIYSRIHVGAALVGLPILLVCVPAFSYIGAALATILIEAGVFSATYLTVRQLRFGR